MKPFLVRCRGSLTSRFFSSTAPLDYYRILGVPQNASLDDIKRTYREQAKRYHPDVASAGVNEAESLAAFKLVNEAYSVLSDSSASLESSFFLSFNPHSTHNSHQSFS